MSDGIININKPAELTSHDVVSKVRTLTHTRRVGHAGTLDPLATGVLLICIGKATRVSEYLMEGTKTYRTRMHLGITTDTFDSEGQVTSEQQTTVSRSLFESALEQFTGKINQLPPVFSAVKLHGTPLHRLVRQGVEVSRESLRPRRIEIHEIRLTEWAPPHCSIEVICSPGTYIRALVHDVGQIVGCGSHVTQLTRLASGQFSVEDSIGLDEFFTAASEDHWIDLLHPIDAALQQFPAIQLEWATAQQLCLGQSVTVLTDSAENVTQPGTFARAYAPDERFLAIVTYNSATSVWKPHKVFCAPESLQCA